MKLTASLQLNVLDLAKPGKGQSFEMAEEKKTTREILRNWLIFMKSFNFTSMFVKDKRQETKTPTPDLLRETEAFSMANKDGVNYSDGKKIKCNGNCLCFNVIGCLGSFFEILGRKVARHPSAVALICILVTLISGLGIFNFQMEVRPYKLWVSRHSHFLKVLEWQADNFPNSIRYQMVIWEAENVLTARAIKEMYRLHERVLNMQEATTGATWPNICSRVPVVNLEDKYSQDMLKLHLQDDYVDYDFPRVYNTSDYDYTMARAYNLSDYDYTVPRAYNMSDYDETLPTMYNMSDYEHTLPSTYNISEYDKTSPSVHTFNDDETLFSHRIKRSTDAAYFDLSFLLPREEYCNLTDNFQRLCYELGLLEIWGHNKEEIEKLTDDKIINDVNKIKVSKVFGYNTNFEKYIGEITRNSSGHVVSAKAATQIWITQLDQEAIARGESAIDTGNGQRVDKKGLLWEKAWSEIALEDKERPSDIIAHVQSASTYGIEGKAGLMSDVKYLIIGFTAMLVFVNFSLGRRNLVEQRPLLALLGLFSVAQSIIIALGLCSALGIPYCPLSTILPALLVGHGIDDMFVIMAAWETFEKHKTASKNLIERAGLTMKKAGVAVTVTSLTDMIAFAAGSLSEMPALISFCMYASIGIFAVFVLQITFFLAALVKDQDRLNNKRNGLIWCITHDNWYPSSCSKRDLMNEFFSKIYSKFIFYSPVRICVVVFSTVLIGLSIAGVTQLRREFDPMLIVPSSSFLHSYIDSREKFFPSVGEQGYIYFANVSLPDELSKLAELTEDLKNSDPIVDVTTWFNKFSDYYYGSFKYFGLNLTSETFYDALSLFLNSASGAEFQKDIIFENRLNCSDSAPKVKAFRINIVHTPSPSPDNQVVALRTINTLIKESNISGFAASYANVYSAWEANEVIGRELPRNLALAGIVVGLVTFVLLGSFWISVLVMLCVVSSVVGTAAIMAIWGLTVDTVSCITLILSIGISVDFSAHIAHGYLSAHEAGTDKIKRSQMAVASVGSAIFHGGLSTLLTFVILAGSSSHVFLTFFKVFTSAVLLGLFFGLMLLPVMLSVVGSVPKCKCLDNQNDEKETSAEDMQNKQNNMLTREVSIIKIETFPNGKINCYINKSYSEEDESKYIRTIEIT